ncbi:MAG: Sugar transporter [Marteilia pararefringens]
MSGSNDILYVISLISFFNGITSIIFTPIVTTLSDRYGRRPFILLSLITSQVSNILLVFNSYKAFFYSEIISFVFDQLNTLILISIYDISDESSRSKFYALNAATLPGGAFLGFLVCSLAYDDSLPMAQRDYSKLGTILFTSTMAITVYYYLFMPETLNSQYDDEDLRNEMMKNLNPFQVFLNRLYIHTG